MTILVKKLYPEFVIGFDLVGQEDTGIPLKHFVDQLMTIYQTEPRIPFFFHAGETSKERRRLLF